VEKISYLGTSWFLRLIKYYYGNQIRDIVVDWTRGTWGRSL